MILIMCGMLATTAGLGVAQTDSVKSRSSVGLHGVIPGRTTRGELLALPKWGTPLQTHSADDSFDVFKYYEVTPTEDERNRQRDILRKAALANSSALSPDEIKELKLAQAAQGLNGVELLDYKFAPWLRVTAQVQHDVVWAIDAFPPSGTTLKQIEAQLELGEYLGSGESPDTEPPLDSELDAALNMDNLGILKTAIPYLVAQSLRVGPTTLPFRLRYKEYANKRVAVFYEADDDREEVKVVRLFGDIPQRYPILGVGLNEVTDPKKIPSEVNRHKVVMVGSVMHGSAGQEAGFQVGDIILNWNGREISEIKQFQQTVLGSRLNMRSVIEVWRDGQQITLRAAPRIQTIASAYVRRGNYLLKHQQVDPAIQDLTMALKLEPSNYGAHLLRGEAHEINSDFHAAVADLSTAIEINPNLENAFLTRAEVYKSLKQFDKAIADYNTALKIVPENAKAFVNRGIAWGMSGDLEKSLADMNRAIEIDPKYPPAYTNRGTTLEKLNMPERAIADYTEAIQLDPRFTLAYQKRATLYRKQSQTAKAEADEDLVKKIQAENDSSSARFAYSKPDQDREAGTVSAPPGKPDEKLQFAVMKDSIEAAVEQVKAMVLSGKSSYEIGQWVTNTIDDRIQNQNSPWEGFVLGVSEDQNKAFKAWRDKGVFNAETAAKWAWENRVGQCEEQACTAYYILSQAKVPGSLRIVSTATHAFVVWGMAEGANVNDFKTWGRNVVVVDGWLGATMLLQNGIDVGRVMTAELQGSTYGPPIKIYQGEKWDQTPVFAGILVIGGPWELVVNWRNNKLQKNLPQSKSKLLIKQIGDTIEGELTKDEMKISLPEGRIYANGVIRFTWSALQLGGEGHFKFTDKEGKQFKGDIQFPYSDKGKNFLSITPFTGKVDERTITLFPDDGIVRPR